MPPAAADASFGAAAALGCLRRAETRAREAECAPLRLQVLRQTRAQLLEMGAADDARTCEATIDEVHAEIEAARAGSDEAG